MHRGWLIAAISSFVLLVPTERSTGQQPDDKEVVAKKVALPPASNELLHGIRPLAELADAFESGQFQVRDDASVEELVQYMRELSSLSNDLADDYRNIQASITRAQGKVAESIIEDPESLSDQDFYLAARLGLSRRISQIPFSTHEQQQQTVALVARQLEIGTRQGLRLDEIRNVQRTADYLERHADRGLAAEACRQFANIIRAADSQRFQDTLASLEDTSRRLELVGQPFELAGTTVDGRPLRWSDYQNKVVLVNFWATWSVPSIAEIPQLKRYYESYRDSGFEIIGVSLDENRGELEAIIAKEQIPWTNLFDEATGVDHPMALKYGVRAIPTGFLIDQQGNVVSTGARGADLERLLNRILGPESAVARELAAAARWLNAANELQRLVTKNPDNLDYRLALGTVQVLGDDPLGYAGTCQAAWSTIMQERSPAPARLIPLYCLPAEHSLDRSRIYEIARAIRAQDDSNPARLAVILSAYRSGLDEACIQEAIVDGDAFSMAASLLVQAMAAHRLGQSDQASEWLEEGRAIVALRLDDLLGSEVGDDLPYEYWICCTVARLILSEADDTVPH